MTYENLLQEAADENVYVIEDAPFQSRANGLIRNDVIGINRTVRQSTQRACVLAEELGHYHTTVGDIMDQSSDANRKQELRARLWSYNKLIGLHGIISGFEHHCRTIYEMAEYLGVTEEFFLEAMYCYRNKYGLFTRCDNYLIYFEPSLKVVGLLNVQGEDTNE
nr:MAG TPA: IrrE protein [Caudoviricetes sp.]